jgi:hypothetical protein
MECPHCEHLLFGVPCPKCGRKTINLTLIARYGKTSCFCCRTEMDHLPEGFAAPARAIPHPSPVAPARPAQEPLQEALRPTVTARSPKTPIMPSAAEAVKAIEQSLVGLERATLDREMLRAPDLRVVAARFLDAVQELLTLEAAMAAGEVTEKWLRDACQLEHVAQLCFTPLLPVESALLPPAVQAWMLAVDDVARYWQYTRRCWLAEQCGLALMPTVPGITTTNPIWHEIDGPAPVISEVLRPGFLLHGDVLRKAVVLA